MAAGREGSNFRRDPLRDYAEFEIAVPWTQILDLLDRAGFEVRPKGADVVR